ncbi:bifunctional 4-hydroxy-2-oxoglutarate aldolase/2-dehydro-3-deoxy-phosphogluconate aldolase [Desulfobacterales bacterium RS19-109]|uniref:2-dehydro-3-deoxy-phosphogluconate aldolase n=2 Tax=Thiovibrio frasassiensis TaxID=2984131 RepID=A0A9X4MCP1_9BACT|nr:bifunctional 4-hydroxy-2-oxoglutarate aldolase/2-dehydro-3-deoxy-phosphogluconate aldolase [Thiovibrio frasassiensis]
MQPGEVFAQGPVVPVMVIKDLAHAVPLARALVAGGIRVLEITLRTPVAVAAIREIARQVPEAVVGAGTVTNAEDLVAVSEAGAVFAISPGLTPELLDAANRGSIALIPGIATVSELMVGLQWRYDHFKFFPAEAAGGIPMLKAIAGPFPKVTFCPTGGISVENYRDYLALGNVACVGGSWVAPAEAVARGDWELISQLARDAVLDAGK